MPGPGPDFVYSQMEHLPARRTAVGRGCPFDCECHVSEAHYEAGMLRATDALLARSMSFAIGVMYPGLAQSRAQRFIDVYREVTS